MIAHERHCSNCRRTILPRGGRTPAFCAYCGQRLDDQAFRRPTEKRPLPRIDLGEGRPLPRGQLGTKTSGRAVAALVLGIIAPFTFTCAPLPGIIAIALGVQARNEISASGGFLTGRGLATAGIVLGMISLIFVGFVCIGVSALC